MLPEQAEDHRLRRREACLVKAVTPRYAIARIGRKLPRRPFWTSGMTRHHATILARLATAALLGLSAAACTMGEEFHRGYLIDETAVNQVQANWSAEQVLQTLGTPSTVSTVGNKSWYYISQRSRRRVAFLGESLVDQRVTAVYFNKNLKVERVALYGLQDGKLFDFVSRTTPAGGGDLNFVSQLFRGLGSFVPNP
jgi:outer membrane protein assembly factor BamE (lipoprotein component of BamABCDE complex)